MTHPNFFATPPNKAGIYLNRIIKLHVAAYVLGLLLQLGFFLWNETDMWKKLEKCFVLDPKKALWRPWTLLTYIFVMPADNLIWAFLVCLNLYFIGRMAATTFGLRHFLGIYFIGSIAAGLSFVLCSKIFPYLQEKGPIQSSPLAVIYAFNIASAVYSPNEPCFLLFFPVQRKHAAFCFFAFALVACSLSKKEGHYFTALLGGLVGMCYAYCLKWRRRCRNKFKILPKGMGANPHDEPRSDVDAILEKISRSGYHALTSEEKKKLFEEAKSP